MSTPNPQTLLSGLALRLVRSNLLSAADAERLQNDCQNGKVPFVTKLVESKKLDGATIARAASEEFGLPLFALPALEPDPAVSKLVDNKLVRKHKILPLFKRGNRLFVAVSDPANIAALGEIKFNTGLATEPILVDDTKLEQALSRFLDANDTSLINTASDDGLENLNIGGGDEDAAAAAAATEADVNDAPIVKFVNKVLVDAINRGASDIHIEPYEKTYRVRYRMDGVLQEIANPPLGLSNRISARLKILAKMDISERRIPQDGRIKLRLSANKAIDFRVSSLPTLFGEKIVLRILDASSAMMGADKLGFEPEQQVLYVDAIQRPYGMVLVTGPTGSGKTVTLYTALNILNTLDRNISTAEDPVEINLPGINQVNINEKAKLTFASALRAFLRQDPDIIMVGEIRDLETAEIAIKAAQTGHMVISTLHTNDAPSTISRLMNMGVAPFNIASAVNLIIAQRLARRLCGHCRRLIKLPTSALIKAGFAEQELDTLEIFQPAGCDQCNDGYKGRVGIYQVMPVSAAMGEIIMREGNALDIEQQARLENIPNLRQSGLRKVRAGLTSLEEVERVTNI